MHRDPSSLSPAEAGDLRQRQSHQSELQKLAASAPVVVFGSSLTDVRPITERLDRLGIRYRQVTMGMGSAPMRERFHELQSLTGWRMLPQIFVDGKFTGGYQEFFAHDFEDSGESGSAIPAPALWLGFGGLVPFVAGAAGLWAAPVFWRAPILTALLVYGAVILSFIGAVHWGVALRGPYRDRELWRRLGIGVLPALVGWAALLTEPVTALVVLTTMFVAMYLVDRSILRAGIPTWYTELRSWLSAGVVLSLLMAMLAVGVGSSEIATAPGTDREQGLVSERAIDSVVLEPTRAPHRPVIF